MSGARHANFNRALVLSLLMMMMTQVGYLESMNAWTNGEETLDESNDVLETGGSGSSFVYANDKLSAGSGHTCGILDNGDLKCWGGNWKGQLGDGSNTDTNAPSTTAIDLGTGRTAVAVSSGDQHTCAILDNGELKCWGWDNNGQLGDGGGNTDTNAPSSTAIDLGTGRTAVAVSPGLLHTCAILDNGDLKCWGSNQKGQLGDGSNTNTNAPSSTAIDLGTGRTAVAVSSGNQHTCAILDNGELKCWGWDNYGQLGDGGGSTDTNAPSSTAIDLGTGRTAVAVDAGQHYTCVIKDNGEAKCWGRASHGNLGEWSGTAGPSGTAIDLGTGRTAVAVSAAIYHTCAILDNGDLKCWGRDYSGQLGDGGSNTDISAPSSTAIDLGTGRTAVAVSAAGSHTCAILDNGDLKCWGYDLYGQLGDGGSNTNQGSPVSLSGSNTWDSSIGLSSGAGSGSGSGSSSTSSFAYSNDKLSAGGYHTCAILDNGDLKCWGWDQNGQLGDGGSNTNTDAPSSTAIDLGTGRTAVAVSSGTYHTCAVLDNGDVKCWGRDNHGQLGDGGTNTGTNAPSSTAIDLGTGRTAVAVHAGFYHTCAILDNGDMKCWGRDNYGQLGDGGGALDTDAPSSTPIDLGTGRTAVAASVGEYHTCAILDNGDMKCWGTNTNGQLGNGGVGSVTAVQSPPSTSIDLGTGRTAVALSAGSQHTCAILDNGDMKCWGRDNYGQLGEGGTNTGTNAPSSTAIDLGTGRTAVAITGGGFHTCAILDNGDLKCWGSDSRGQLGDGGTNTDTDAPSSTAIDLGTGRTVVAISAGDYHTCATLDNGDAKCWGYDWAGQLGDGGSNTDQGSPTPISGTDTWDSSTGLSTSSYTLTPSVEGANLLIDEPMTNITFQYNASASNGSGSGSNSGTYNGNGTAWMVKDIYSGSGTSSLSELTAVGNTLYLKATDGTNGFELWKSDGTASGTVMVKDIYSGSSSSSPTHLTAIGNTLYFQANGGINGAELMMSLLF